MSLMWNCYLVKSTSSLALAASNQCWHYYWSCAHARAHRTEEVVTSQTASPRPRSLEAIVAPQTSNAALCLCWSYDGLSLHVLFSMQLRYTHPSERYDVRCICTSLVNSALCKLHTDELWKCGIEMEQTKWWLYGALSDISFSIFQARALTKNATLLGRWKFEVLSWLSVHFSDHQHYVGIRNEH